MPKIAIVSLLVSGLVLPPLATIALAAPQGGAATGPQRQVDPRTKAWFEHTIEHMLDESSSMAKARMPSRHRDIAA